MSGSYTALKSNIVHRATFDVPNIARVHTRTAFFRTSAHNFHTEDGVVSPSRRKYDPASRRQSAQQVRCN